MPDIMRWPAEPELDRLPERLEVVDEGAPRERTLRPTEAPIRLLDQLVILNDGTRYDVRSYEPSHPKDILVSYTTPWVTDLDGFNNLVGIGLARRGMHAVAISPQRGRVCELPQQLRRASLWHDAHAQHAALDWVEATKNPQTKPRQLLNIGYSRGAMIGLGVHALAASYDRAVLFGDFTDPCLEHRPEFKDISVAEADQYIGHEIVELAKGLTHYRPKQLSGLLSPSLARPSFWTQQIAVTKAIFEGTAGQFVAFLPADTAANVTLYDHSVLNHAKDWQHDLEDFPLESTH
jgi:hypothetical protein